VNVVVVGATAQSTPALAAWLAQHARVPVRVALMARDARRLHDVTRACRVLGGNAPVSFTPHLFTDREADGCLAEADVVLLQVRIGGYAGRAFDETFPQPFGVCGDEGLGPGGLAAAWRAWPALGPLLARVAATARRALILVLTSPVGIVVRAAREACPDHLVLGICELPWTTLRTISRAVGVSADAMTADYLGVNHLGWFHRVTAHGRDLIDEYGAQREGVPGFPSAATIRHYGAIPLPYLRLVLDPVRALAEQRGASSTRAATLSALDARAYGAFARGDRNAIMAAVAARPAPWYTDAVGPFLLALGGQDNAATFFLTTRNDGYCPGLAPDEILEIPHTVRAGRLALIPPRAPAPLRVVDVVAACVRAERLGAAAVTRREPPLLRAALDAHPMLRTVTVAEPLARCIAAQT
jgi:6-phospho-beta-glucosidase